MNLIHSIRLHNKHNQLWLWPASCTNQPKTLSFRATTIEDSVFMNPSKESLIEADDQVELTTLGSCFINSSETSSVLMESDCYGEVETIVRGARSDRLFFEPESTSSIFETQRGSMTDRKLVDFLPKFVENNRCQNFRRISDKGRLCKESVAMVMESGNPYVDFKESMEEMMEIHGLNDWDCLEELLGWYLRMNKKNNHEFIVVAFVDLLVGISGGGGGGGGGSGGGGLFLDHSIASFSSVASTYSSPSS